MTTNGISINQVWQYLQRYQQHINTAVVVLLVIYLVALVADITWRFIPDPDQQESQQASQSSATNRTSGNQQQRANVNNIQRLNLFGNKSAEPVKEEPVVTDAPQTNLNLTLTGVVASNENKAGAAIIANRGTQATYGIGEKVEGTNATVQEVYEDRIIIKNGSRMETLMLEGEDFAKMADSQVVKQAKPKKQYRSPVSLKQLNRVSKKPDQFSDYITVNMIQSNGDIEGFRVNPGKDKSLFSDGFLQPNDIITDINGLDLTNPNQARELVNVLTKAKRLDIRLTRNGTEEKVLIELPGRDKED